MLRETKNEIKDIYLEDIEIQGISVKVIKNLA